MSKQLIINADDFGLSTGANQGIIACHRAGSISSATMMVNMPAVEGAFDLAKENPSLGVGLHFNLTLGKPLSDKSQVASLLGPDGQFLPRTIAEKMAAAGKLNSKQIKCELGHQWERFLSFGMTPTHLDSHQHIHVFPQVFEVVAQFCIDHNLPVRIPWPWKPPVKLPIRRKMRAWMLKRMITRNMKQWGGRLRTNASFASIFDLQVDPKDIHLDDYRNILSSQHQAPFELMVHPALLDGAQRQLVKINDVNELEYKLLSDEVFATMIRESGFSLINYSKL